MLSMTSVPVCPQNNILVEIPSKFQEEIITSSGLALYKDTTFRPEWNVTISGAVVSVPHKLTAGGSGEQGLWPERLTINPKVQPGDQVLFSYLVVMDRSESNNAADVFSQDKHDPNSNPFYTTWSNKIGLRLVRFYEGNDRYEVGLLNVAENKWISKFAGTGLAVENWMGQFTFSETIERTFRNLLFYEGKDYWKVDYPHVFAIRRGKEYEMVWDYVMLRPVREPMKHKQGLIEVYNMDQGDDHYAVGQVVSIGDTTMPLKVGDKVCTDIRYIERYEVDGEDMWITKQSRLAAIVK